MILGQGNGDWYSWIFTQSEYTYSNCTTVNGSPIITGISNTAYLRVGFPASGTGVPGGAKILSIDSSSQVTLDANCTASGSVSITFDCQFVALSDVVWVTACGGGQEGDGSSGSQGNNGGATSFGSYLTAAGGSASPSSPASNNGGRPSNNNYLQGNGGQVFEKIPIRVTIGESIDITIGAGGTGGEGSDGGPGIIIVEWAE